MSDPLTLRPAGLAVLPGGYQSLFDAAVAVLVADSTAVSTRLRATWNGGGMRTPNVSMIEVAHA